ncbi:DUF5667 domain-containing protein [Streptosporangium soli]|nr:DUF5667 domain-containing protein [Streptosporangium sp. KLBMP 9127]
MRKWRPQWWRPATSRRSQEACVAERLAEIGAAQGSGPRPGFRARLRDDLLAVYADEREETGAALRLAAPRRRRRGRRLPQLAMLGVTFLVIVTGLVAYRSIPGDTLYPLKRAAESTLLRMSTDEMDRADRKLASAKERATEVATLLGSTDHVDRVDLVDKTLREMEMTTRSAICTLTRVKRDDARSATKLKRFAEEQHNTVEPMLPKMDEETQRQANGYLNYIDGLAAP